MGKLIVLEGIDGSGKSSQYRLLCEHLRKDRIPFTNIVFPRYQKESSALIRAYLNGEYGKNPRDVNAYTASTFYAVDRFASYREDWGNVYEKGGLILADRYTTSNAVHQGSKLADEALPEFFAWLSDLEYQRMMLPKPDAVIYLDTSLDVSLRRMEKRQRETGTHADIHEKDVEYLSACLHTAEIACNFFSWHRIPYLDSAGKERTIEDKQNEIYSLVLDILALK